MTFKKQDTSAKNIADSHRAFMPNKVLVMTENFTLQWGRRVWLLATKVVRWAEKQRSTFLVNGQ